MKKNKGYIVYGAVGILLAGAVLFTNSFGVSQINQNAYKRFVDESQQLSDIGFDGFQGKDYTVRFFDGDHDYVMRDGEETKKENPKLDVLSATAWQVGEEYQVLVPVYESMKGMTNVLDGVAMVKQAEDDADVAASEKSFTEEMYVATICHEAFHCWQLSKFESQIEKSLANVSGDREQIITEEIDSKGECVTSIEKEAVLLQEAYAQTDSNQKLELIREALAEEEARQGMLSEQAKTVEYYVENIEGSAQYIEAMAYKDLTSEERFEEYYLQKFSYQDGSGKYYFLGLMKCLLLDQVEEGWQSDFSYENGTSMLLEKVLK